MNHYNILHYEDAYNVKNSQNKLAQLLILLTPLALSNLMTFARNLDDEIYRLWWP